MRDHDPQGQDPQAAGDELAVRGPEDLAVRGPEELQVYEPDDVYDADGHVIDAWAIDTRVIPRREQIRQWLADCWWGFYLWCRKAILHTTRSWLYFLRASRYSPLGFWRAFVWWQWWVRDVETLMQRRELAADRSLDQDKRISKGAQLREERASNRFWRWVGTGAFLLPYALLVRWAWEPWPLLIPVGVGTIVLLGIIGAQRGDIVTHVDVPVELALTEQALIEGFIYAKITKDDPVTVAGVPRQVTNGWYAELMLPRGMKLADVLKNLDSLASGLDVSVDRIEIDPLPKKSERAFGVFIADHHPEDVVVPDWPYLDADRVSVFRPMVVGWDLRGRPVAIHLMWMHTLMGALPRMGKSTLMRAIGVYTLLDPRADIAVIDFGGGADYIPFRPYAVVFIHGEGDEQILQFVEFLHWLRGEYQRRQAALARLAETDPDRCPEGKITEALANLKQFRPLVVLVDEFQVATMFGKLGEQIVTEWASLEKVSPKVGITFVKATQAADDAVPTELRNIALQRIALTVATYHASIALLGNAAHNMGLDAAKLGGVPGYGIVYGGGSSLGPGYRGKVSFANITPVDAAAVLARLDREPPPIEATVVPEQVTGRPAEIVTDALEVWPKGQANCHVDVLAARLLLDVANLKDRLDSAGVAVSQQRMTRPDGEKSVRLAVRRADLDHAARSPR